MNRKISRQALWILPFILAGSALHASPDLRGVLENSPDSGLGEWTWAYLLSEGHPTSAVRAKLKRGTQVIIRVDDSNEQYYKVSIPELPEQNRDGFIWKEFLKITGVSSGGSVEDPGAKAASSASPAASLVQGDSNAIHASAASAPLIVPTPPQGIPFPYVQSAIQGAWMGAPPMQGYGYAAAPYANGTWVSRPPEVRYASDISPSVLEDIYSELNQIGEIQGKLDDMNRILGGLGDADVDLGETLNDVTRRLKKQAEAIHELQDNMEELETQVFHVAESPGMGSTGKDQVADLEKKIDFMRNALMNVVSTTAQIPSHEKSIQAMESAMKTGRPPLDWMVDEGRVIRTISTKLEHRISRVENDLASIKTQDRPAEIGTVIRKSGLLGRIQADAEGLEERMVRVESMLASVRAAPDREVSSRSFGYPPPTPGVTSARTAMTVIPRDRSSKTAAPQVQIDPQGMRSSGRAMSSKAPVSAVGGRPQVRDYRSEISPENMAKARAQVAQRRHPELRAQEEATQRARDEAENRAQNKAAQLARNEARRVARIRETPPPPLSGTIAERTERLLSQRNRGFSQNQMESSMVGAPSVRQMPHSSTNAQPPRASAPPEISTSLNERPAHPDEKDLPPSIQEKLALIRSLTQQKHETLARIKARQEAVRKWDEAAQARASIERVMSKTPPPVHSGSPNDVRGVGGAGQYGSIESGRSAPAAPSVYGAPAAPEFSVEDVQRLMSMHL